MYQWSKDKYYIGGAVLFAHVRVPGWNAASPSSIIEGFMFLESSGDNERDKELERVLCEAFRGKSLKCLDIWYEGIQKRLGRSLEVVDLRLAEVEG